MKKISWQRISILGVVLMGASAVTAAVLPTKNAPKDVTGSLTQSSVNGSVLILSCTVTAAVSQACNVTDGTATTAAGQADSTVGGFQTANNTTTV